MGMHKGSMTEWLSTFNVGERRYRETTLDKYANAMRTITANCSRSEHLVNKSFSTNLFTCVGLSQAGDVRYLICVERKG